MADTAMEPESINDLAARLGRARLTVSRWIHTGLSIGGRIVKLQARRVGGRWEITREAWAQFQSDTNPQAVPTPESPADETRRAKAAQRALSEVLGV